MAVASQARTPGEIAARAAAPPPSEITVAVNVERLTHLVELSCQPQARTQIPLTVPTGSDGSAPIVTGLPAKDGASVRSGRVAIEISGRPLLVLSGQLPAFRDMRPGGSGPDVRQLQRELVAHGWLAARAVTGMYDGPTSTAVEKMYLAAGYQPSWTSPDAKTTLRNAAEAVAAATTALADANSAKPVDKAAISAAKTKLADARQALADTTNQVGAAVPQAELAFVPGGSAHLELGTLTLGTHLSSNSGAALTSGAEVLSCPVTDFDPSLLQAGQPATIDTGGALPATAGLLEVDTAAAGSGPDTSSGGATGTIATALVSLPKSLQTIAASGSPTTVHVQIAQAPAVGTVVPLSALWARPGGTTVVQVLRGSSFVDDPVSVTFQADGLAQVEATQPLTAADRVRVGSTP
jgi:hypothetical protein